MASCPRLPKQNPACGFPAPGSPDDIGESKHYLDCGVQVLSKRQLEPRAILQTRPVRPTSLSATIQGVYPLALYLLPHPVELGLAVMQAKVLIEAS